MVAWEKKQHKKLDSLGWTKSSFSLFIFHLLASCDGLVCYCRTGGVAKRESLWESSWKGWRPFVSWFIEKKWSFFSYLPRQKLFKAFLENRWPPPWQLKRERKKGAGKVCLHFWSVFPIARITRKFIDGIGEIRTKNEKPKVLKKKNQCYKKIK